MFYFSQQNLWSMWIFGAGRWENGVAAEWPKWQVRQANIWAEIYWILWSKKFLESSLKGRTIEDVYNNGLQNVRKQSNLLRTKRGSLHVRTWIRFANPWIRTVSWVWILTSKRFDSYLTIQIPDLHRIVVHESGLGKIHFILYIRIQPIFKRFDLFSRIQRILTNPHES